jgi:hypothetical protein
METSPFLPLPEGRLIHQVEQTDIMLTVTVISTRTEAACPDVPCGDRQVVLRPCIRKFFCETRAVSSRCSLNGFPTWFDLGGRGSHRLLESRGTHGYENTGEPCITEADMRGSAGGQIKGLSIQCLACGLPHLLEDVVGFQSIEFSQSGVRTQRKQAFPSRRACLLHVPFYGA